MGRKRADEDGPEEVVEEVAEPRDHKVWVGLDHAKNGTYDYVEHEAAEPKDRSLMHGGVRFEHCAEDADGCWLYRATV